MKIKKQPVISWLLDENYKPSKNWEITVPNISNNTHVGYLSNGTKWLNGIREKKPNWGLPELLMPSFEKVIKNEKSFYNIDYQLFQEFCNEEV